ncbi:hypothetical protein [Psychroflexus planctonicus]|uniref:hypothetical protein n=1 Tax=Psychroflexus planctonicus TaxID=1526575 RepID=UPI00166F0149|nr:hypothetical protein [Psychroflexus planctonicus]
MKHRINHTFLLLLSLILFWNCSSDDDNPSQDNSPKNYFPLVVENQWQYNNKQTANNETQDTQETLSVANEEQTENGNVFLLDSDNNQTGVSFTSILSNGQVYKNEDQLLLTGSVDLGLDQTEIPDFDIDFENVVIYNNNAIDGDLMFSEDQNTTLPEFNNITLNLSLSIESVSLGNIEEIDVNGEIYEDVIGSQFIVSIGVDATTTVPPLPFPITVQVIEFQEVINSTNYFANEVGLVQSETNLNVNFSDELNQIPDFNLEDIMVLIEQELATFQVTLEE